MTVLQLKPRTKGIELEPGWYALGQSLRADDFPLLASIYKPQYGYIHIPDIADCFYPKGKIQFAVNSSGEIKAFERGRKSAYYVDVQTN